MGSNFIIVGAGIVGASVAYSLARRGASVSLIDTSLPGSGVTGDSFAWIGDSGVVDGPTAALRRTSTEDYRRLEAELDGVEIEWTGSLLWGPGSPSRPRSALGPGQRWVSAAQLASIEPNLREPPVRAVHAAGDGALDPLRTTEALVQAARDHGAKVMTITAVRGLRIEQGAVVGVDTHDGVLRAGTVVVAAGVGTPSLCASVGVDIPVSPSPALLLTYAVPPGLVRTVVSGANVEVRQRGNRLLAADAYHGERTHLEVEQTAHRTGARIAATLRGAENIDLLSARIGIRPMPADGEPIIGPTDVRGLYVTVMHSGVTLAATVGRLAADELMDGEPRPELVNCRPTRFGGSSSHRE